MMRIAHVVGLAVVSFLGAACGGGGGGGGQAGSAGAAGAAGSGGTGGGTSIPVGPQGSVGNLCLDDGTCDPDLTCNQYSYCQPASSSLPGEVVQAVPPADSVAVPNNSPILLFTSGNYTNVAFDVTTHTPGSIQSVTEQLSATKLPSSTGYDIFILAPKQPFPLGASVVVTMSGELSGTLVFNVDHEAPAPADPNLGFENGGSASSSTAAAEDGSSCGAVVSGGFKGFGDTALIDATGTLIPSQGSKQLALSTGDALCGAAIGGTTSIVVSGPIQSGGSSLSFDYNFQSSEFDEYCNSSFDDTFLAVLTGPKGAVAKIVDSVNIVCAAATQQTASFPGQPDNGDAIYNETGIQSFTLTGDVGSPRVLTFVVTDVGDAAYSSVVGIDNIVAN